MDGPATPFPALQAEDFLSWVKDPTRVDHWRKAFAESKSHGIASADCTFIVFSETHLAARSLEAKLSRGAKDAGLNVSAQAIELVAGWLVGEWWGEEAVEAGGSQ